MGVVGGERVGGGRGLMRWKLRKGKVLGYKMKKDGEWEGGEEYR